jgi:hypothetical protein
MLISRSDNSVGLESVSITILSFFFIYYLSFLFCLFFIFWEQSLSMLLRWVSNSGTPATFLTQPLRREGCKHATTPGLEYCFLIWFFKVVLLEIEPRVCACQARLFHLSHAFSLRIVFKREIARIREYKCLFLSFYLSAFKMICLFHRNLQ